MNRSSISGIQARLKKAGVWSKKELGQHFLVDEKVLEKIISTSQLSEEDTVVEIGPGMGILTAELKKRAGEVICFEIDPEMVRILRQDFLRLRVIEGDVLLTASLALAGLKNYKIVANIPYQITTPLLRLFLEGEVGSRPQSLTMLVQKEVAKRLAAAAKKPSRGYLSVLCQYFAEIVYVETVPKTAFWPVPEVDSALIYLRVRSERLLPEDQERRFLKFVHNLFIHPRKQLKNVLAGLWGLEVEKVKDYFVWLGLPETVRSQELTIEEWKILFEKPL